MAGKITGMVDSCVCVCFVSYGRLYVHTDDVWMRYASLMAITANIACISTICPI